MYLCVRDLRPTSPHCWLFLWESAVTSWLRLSAALWLQGGQLEESLAGVGVGFLPCCCCCCVLAGSPATSCATSPPENIIIVISEDNQELHMQLCVARRVNILLLQLTGYLHVALECFFFFGLYWCIVNSAVLCLFKLKNGSRMSWKYHWDTHLSKMWRISASLSDSWLPPCSNLFTVYQRKHPQGCLTRRHCLL